MITVDRTKIDQSIENMGTMFNATKEVLASYEEEKKVLEKRGEDLNKKVAELQEQHTQLLLDREIAKDNTSDYIYLSKQLADTQKEMRIIVSLQEELKWDFKQLKKKYVLTIQNTYGKDLSAKSQFDVNANVELVRYELLNAIADYAKEVRKQQQPLMEIIGDEFLDDEELMENNLSFRRAFDFDSTYLSYWAEAGNSVIGKNQVFSACSGNLDPNVRKPKVKEVE
ncbi:hypothetical protein SAMN05878482_103486 [Peribacillus simplex]|uniref:Uncharacterized protein n=1 Tax=Peribacillus simplex TaxID=1478 RepID=A0A9X8R9J8_9BACI|nr:hypothetical protein [Peribacillus simplex]SIR38192.1 hypothetical protein SAMN05878482_103486 [Peribacillus simplex]